MNTIRVDPLYNAILKAHSLEKHLLGPDDTDWDDIANRSMFPITIAGEFKYDPRTSVPDHDMPRHMR